MAAKIKNHSKLGLSFAEFGALLGTRTMLANNAVVDAKGRHENFDEKTHEFNMSVPCNVNGCGSVACIGGTMGQIMGMNAQDASNYVYEMEGSKNPLANLFYPPQQYDFDKIKPAQAVKAIDNFLKDGKPRWDKVLPKTLLDPEYED